MSDCAVHAIHKPGFLPKVFCNFLTKFQVNWRKKNASECLFPSTIIRSWLIEISKWCRQFSRQKTIVLLQRKRAQRDHVTSKVPAGPQTMKSNVENTIWKSDLWSVSCINVRKVTSDLRGAIRLWILPLIFHLSGKTLQLTFSNMLCGCIWVMDAIIYTLIPFQLHVVYQDFFMVSPSQSGGDWVQIENVHKQNDKTSAQTVTLLALNTNIKKQIKNESLQTCTKSGHLRCMSTISILQTLTSCKIAKIKAELLQNISLTHADTLNENIPSTFNYYAHSSLFKYCTTLPPANF